MNRKDRRALKKLTSDKGAKNLEESMGLFDLLPENCSTCNKDFDKKSREMAFTWSVVVRKEEKVVRLFCPECMTKAQQVLKDATDPEEDSKEGSHDSKAVE